jgi:hypothetical protein
MAATPGQSLVLRVDSVDQIFNAPDANPFSANEVDVLGQAALDRLIVRLQAYPLRHWEDVKLVVALPADQVTPDLQPRLAEALRRYCTARIEDNRLQIRLSRLQHSFGMVAVIVVVLAVMAIAYLLFTTIFSGASSTAQGLVAGAICIFAWVILWDPLEALAFDWVAPRRENNVLQRIMKMELVVQRQD